MSFCMFFDCQNAKITSAEDKCGMNQIEEDRAEPISYDEYFQERFSLWL